MNSTSTHLALTLALSLVCIPLAAQKPKQADAELRDAEGRYRSHTEANCHRATRICVRLNSVESVEVMLDVLNRTRRVSRLHLHPAHYRDIVWEGLSKITDIYARKRVEIELRRNKKNAFVRQWCARLLGVYRDHAFGGSLKRALGDRDRGVKRWAARALGWMKYRQAEARLKKMIHNDDIYVRANVVEALARIDPIANQTTFVTCLRDDADGGVRCALLGAAVTIYSDRTEEFSVAMLDDVDWRPRMQAVDNLAKIRTLTSIDGLVRATVDGRPVVAARAIEALQNMCEKPIRSARVWGQWWKDHRATFVFPLTKEQKAKLEEEKAKLKKERAEQGRESDKGSNEDDPTPEPKPEPKPKRASNTVVYNDIPMDSDHAAFLIDRSVAMKQPLESKGLSKEKAAYAELERVLTKMRDKMVFNVFGYHEEMKSFSKKPVELTEKNQKRALKFIKKMKLGRAKDIWQLLERVVEDPTLDTAYLLSSGEPDIGTYVHWNRVTYHLADMNRFHKVTVHTIAYSGRQWYRDQLEKIAESTGGKFRWFD